MLWKEKFVPMRMSRYHWKSYCWVAVAESKNIVKWLSWATSNIRGKNIYVGTRTKNGGRLKLGAWQMSASLGTERKAGGGRHDRAIRSFPAPRPQRDQDESALLLTGLLGLQSLPDSH